MTLTDTIANVIDHTRLTFAPDEEPATAIEQLCDEAMQYKFKAVCVPPEWVSLARKHLAGTDVLIATVIGFPEQKLDLATEQALPTVGNMSLERKCAQIEQALADEADELDVVLNVRRFVTEYANEATIPKLHRKFGKIRQVSGEACIKLILETDLLTAQQIQAATGLAINVGLDFVKTSTGMLQGGKGATPQAIQIMASTIKDAGAKTQIKASGGIRTYASCQQFIALGCQRIGTSNGVSIMHEAMATALTS